MEKQKQLKTTNDYVKKTKFGRTHKTNLQDFSTYEAIDLVFDEFIHQGTCFFFSIEHCD